MSLTPAWEMEFADSEIRALEWHGSDLHVLFSAVSATQTPASGSAVTGFLQGVEWVVQHASRTPGAVLDSVFGRVRSGYVRFPSGEVLRRLPVPAAWAGDFFLELEPAQADIWVVRGQGFVCRLQPGGVFRESLFC
jgi:hypothetical protein